ncbi:MAG: dihydrofolate reductase [Bacillota bacterium]|nr:dihydrofolate reductase [Bacillota bacterium]
MRLIVCVDKNWGIGREGHLLFPIPADLKQFKAHTLEKVVVLGRLTLSTFPGQRPLPGRKNIILSHDPEFCVENAETAHSLEELFSLLRPYDEENIYVIGGESVYRLLLPYCHLAFVTRLKGDFAADRFLPDLEQEGWQLREVSEEFRHEGIGYNFCAYENPGARDWR